MNSRTPIKDKERTLSVTKDWAPSPVAKKQFPLFKDRAGTVPHDSGPVRLP